MKSRFLIFMILLFEVACLNWNEKINTYIDEHPGRPKEIMQALTERRLINNMTIKEAELSIIYFYWNIKAKTINGNELMYHLADSSGTVYLTMLFKRGFLIRWIYWKEFKVDETYFRIYK